MVIVLGLKEVKLAESQNKSYRSSRFILFFNLICQEYLTVQFLVVLTV